MQTLINSQAARPAPGQIWSLWGLMQRFHAGVFIQSARSTERYLRLIAAGQHNYCLAAYGSVMATGDWCKQLGLTMAAFHANEAQRIISSAYQVDINQVFAEVEQGKADNALPKSQWVLTKDFPRLPDLANRFMEAIEVELRGQNFYCMDNKRAHFYGEKAPFGQDVADRFPKSIDDIEGAAKCLALGQGTATVMHLSRAMEPGLHFLARKLGVKRQNDWGGYLREIGSEVKARAKKPVWRKRYEPFFNAILGDLMAIKQAWRNPTMHVERQYDVDQADMVYHAIKTFMTTLATNSPYKTRGMT